MTPKEMVNRLIDEAGWDEPGLARVCRTTQPTIHRIKTGAVKDPRYSVGSQIERLYQSAFDGVNSSSSVA